jgi:sterol desaturase/sphingolipid hydroxylase (fatty acid hydroxylase superfamily)
MLLLEFAGLFAFILVLGYLLPAGQFYIRYYVFHTPQHDKLRIQQRQPAPGQIHREVLLSLATVAIWGVMATVLLELYKAGHTHIYLHFKDYPLWYLLVSFVLCVIAHDTYFYWTHRFMHWRPVFKYFHLAHHRSIAPTPWAIYAFDPLEAVTQFIGIMLLVTFLPLHPLILLAFLSYDTLVNTAGHTGYEMVPKPVSQHWFFKYFNTVTHHDSHHTNTRVNYGSFLNLWDRWMGTFENNVTPATAKATTRSSAVRERNPNAPFLPDQRAVPSLPQASRSIRSETQPRSSAP